MYRLLAILTLMLSACESADPPPAERQEPLVVYAAYEDMEYLPALFKGFTEETGIVVVVRHRSDAANIADMAAKSGSEPADLLLTRSVWSAWTAADEGLLRPPGPDSRLYQAPEHLRDPDGLWTAVSIDPFVVLATNEPDAFSHYVDLGRGEGSVCLASSKVPANRILLASLLTKYPGRDAELAVRRWVSAFDLPPRESNADAVAEFRAGHCDFAVVPASALAGARPDNLLTPQEVFFDVEAAGIGRHSKNPEAAERLLDWMLGNSFQKQHSEATSRMPIAPPDASAADNYAPLSRVGIAAAGFRYEEAVRMAERARYR